MGTQKSNIKTSSIWRNSLSYSRLHEVDIQVITLNFCPHTQPSRNSKSASWQMFRSSELQGIAFDRLVYVLIRFNATVRKSGWAIIKRQQRKCFISNTAWIEIARNTSLLF